MPKVKTTYAYKIQSIVKQFPNKFVESINNQLYCNLCNYALSCNKCFLVGSHQNMLKHQKALGSRSENLLPQSLQTFLSADIPLYKLNNMHIKNLFRGISHRSPSETTCR